MNPPSQSSPAKEFLHDASLPLITVETKKRKILAVDDDPRVRAALEKVLGGEGYEVVLAENGRESIRQSFTNRFDLLLLDLGLPDLNGWGVFGTLASVNPFVPIILITGKDNQCNTEVFGGANASIEKPFDINRLLETVEALLAESPEMHFQRLTGQGSDTRYESPGAEDGP